MLFTEYPIVSQMGDLSDIAKLQIVDMVMTPLDRPDPEISRLWSEESKSRWLAYKEGKLKTVSYKKVVEKYRT